MPRTLMYHDVVTDDPDESGFPGASAAQYKLSQSTFRLHLEAISDAGVPPPAVISGKRRPRAKIDPKAWMLTFDDGGVSASTIVADELDRHGWKGHFFITGEMIGAPGFLTAEQLLDLHRRGHAIGSHSHTHPPLMSSCSPRQLEDEWARSLNVLQDILGEPVTLASVPGGFYSTAVARAAVKCGILDLFTSEPTPSIGRVGACRIYGRYAIVRTTTCGRAAAIVRGALLPLLSQSLIWNAKKPLKHGGGQYYLSLRELVLSRK